MSTWLTLVVPYQQTICKVKAEDYLGRTGLNAASSSRKGSVTSIADGLTTEFAN